MATTQYTNIPSNSVAKESTIMAFDAYYFKPLELNASVLTAMKGFLTGRGFDNVAAESIAVTLMKQAVVDNVNPMQLLDKLSGFDSVELSALIAEILNANRINTSLLGYAVEFTPHKEVLRNILA